MLSASFSRPTPPLLAVPAPCWRILRIPFREPSRPRSEAAFSRSGLARAHGRGKPCRLHAAESARYIAFPEKSNQRACGHEQQDGLNIQPQKLGTGEAIAQQLDGTAVALIPALPRVLVLIEHLPEQERGVMGSHVLRRRRIHLPQLLLGKRILVLAEPVGPRHLAQRRLA